MRIFICLYLLFIIFRLGTSGVSIRPSCILYQLIIAIVMTSENFNQVWNSVFNMIHIFAHILLAWYSYQLVIASGVINLEVYSM